MRLLLIPEKLPCLYPSKMLPAKILSDGITQITSLEPLQMPKRRK
jgi:hypothetical protein